MASSDFLRFEFVCSHAPARPPRVSVTTFTSYICYSYTLKFGQYRTSLCRGNSSLSSMPCMQFLFIRPRFWFGLPSNSASRRTPLSSANSSYCHACSGLSPPCCFACRAHQSKRLFYVFWQRTSALTFGASAFLDFDFTTKISVGTTNQVIRTRRCHRDLHYLVNRCLQNTWANP